VSIDRYRFDGISALPLIRNCLSNGSRLEGEIYFESLTIIDGYIEGELTTNSGLFIGESAEVNAAIRAESIVIAGKVRGSITASGRIELCPTAKVSGSLTATALLIHEGAWLEGDCSVTSVSILKVVETHATKTEDLSVAKTPLFITVKRKADLRAMGHDDVAISKMTPTDAHKLLEIT
jgi:cytoskeletal protein CcmA (bactofilin family)